MRAPGVEQLDALAELFSGALAARRPESVAVLGVAGGNGLDRIDREVTHRVVGIDVNAEYLAAVAQRYADVAGLELACVDLAEETVTLAPAALVHAALIFEHAGTARCLENALAMVAAGGALSVVLQLPSLLAPAVGESGHSAVTRFRDWFSFVDPEWLKATLLARGFTLASEGRREVASGKAFWMGLFERTAACVVQEG